MHEKKSVLSSFEKNGRLMSSNEEINMSARGKKTSASALKGRSRSGKFERGKTASQTLSEKHPLAPEKKKTRWVRGHSREKSGRSRWRGDMRAHELPRRPKKRLNEPGGKRRRCEKLEGNGQRRELAWPGRRAPAKPRQKAHGYREKRRGTRCVGHRIEGIEGGKGQDG